MKMKLETAQYGRSNGGSFDTLTGDLSGEEHAFPCAFIRSG